MTVSENSKRDIVEMLGVPEERVTNTYEAVEFPRELTERSDDVIAEQLRGSYQLEFRNYLLFYGALEPKKNVARLLDAYMLSGADIPLVVTGAAGWGNDAETKLLAELSAQRKLTTAPQPTGLSFRICQHPDAGYADPGRAGRAVSVVVRGVRIAGP